MPSDDGRPQLWRDYSTLVLRDVAIAQPPSAFSFVAQDRRFLTITQDGRIEIGEGFEPDEAGRKAIEGMRYQLAFIVEAAVKAEREACADLADNFPTWPDWVGTCRDVADDIAAKIRARSTTKTG
jgi:hypothetical protein